MPPSFIASFCALLLLKAFFSCAPVLASGEVAENTAPLFSSYETIPFAIEAPFSQFIGGKSKQNDAPAKIVIGERVIRARIRLRGHSTLGLCDFPKLMLKIDQSTAKGTPFEGTKKLDLNTHCSSKKENAFGGFASVGSIEYPLRESLIYRWLKILGLPGFSSRPARIVYRDNSLVSPKPEIIADAALIEHLSSFLKRAKGTEIRSAYDHRSQPASQNESGPKYIYKDLNQSPQLLNEPLAKIPLFEALIGNPDWDLSGDLIWNLKVIELPNGKWLTIPMDFNLSNLARGVSAPFNVQSIHLFNLVSDETKIQLIREFESKKDELSESLSALQGDEEGLAAFKNAIDKMSANLDALKPAKR